MKEILDVALRALIGFVILLVLIRLIGKKQMGQLTIFTYITGIALGNIAGDMVVHHDIRVIDGVVGMSLWALMTIFIEILSMKSIKVRIALDSEPTIVIKKGEIMQKELKKHRVNMDDLTMLLRTNNVFSIADVNYAILEPNGQLSVMKVSTVEQVVKKDLKLPEQPIPFLPTEIIVDGKIVENNLKELGIDRGWLDTQLKNANVISVEEVFYAEVQSDRSLYVCRKSG